MPGQEDFQKRLQRLEKTKRVTVPRGGGGIDPALANAPGKKKGNGQGLFLLLKLVVVVLLLITMMRVVGTKFTGIDFPGRRAQLETIGKTKEMEYIGIRFAMLADPILVPLFDLNNSDANASFTLAGVSRELSEQANVNLATTRKEKGLLEPVPQPPLSLTKRVMNLLQPDHPNKPQLYHAPAPEGWTRLTSGDLSGDASAYFDAKNAWKGTVAKPDMPWEDLPLLRRFLLSQEDNKVKFNQRGYAYYYNEQGHTIYVEMVFFTRAHRETGAVRLMRKFRQTPDNLMFKLGNIPFYGRDSQFLDASVSKTLKARAKQLNLNPPRYSGFVSGHVQLEFHTNAPKKVIEQFAQTYDYTALQALNIP
ncbi:hypothetical protein GCM10007939_11330 [Amylibacter marinus]|uniref:Uncharacterized protein n=1 Tax=Amylibacter marinus TaxID=1475483 RepID=A0ABQ5VTT4_9RHOB|nr:hypothetical protein [Amylibacter marinus]GLQ34850.1 hypothetical protein GCM10007939_11330 [Amylibacter marinus]